MANATNTPIKPRRNNRKDILSFPVVLISCRVETLGQNLSPAVTGAGLTPQPMKSRHAFFEAWSPDFPFARTPTNIGIWATLGNTPLHHFPSRNLPWAGWRYYCNTCALAVVCDYCFFLFSNKCADAYAFNLYAAGLRSRAVIREYDNPLYVDLVGVIYVHHHGTHGLCPGHHHYQIR